MRPSLPTRLTARFASYRRCKRRLFFEPLEPRLPLAVDFGDAPDHGPGVGTNNYATLLVKDGPRHTIIPGLFLGATVDGEADAFQTLQANGDDSDQALPDDEDGLVDAARDLVLTVGTAPVVRIRATNTTSRPAMLYGWIDFGFSGRFDNDSERASIEVPAGSVNQLFELQFPVAPLLNIGLDTYARFRLSTDPAAAEPTGLAADGEVEDYPARVQLRSTGLPLESKTVRLASGVNGMPTISRGATSGVAIADLGDLDGDGVPDIAVGARDEQGDGVTKGGVYILFLQPNGTVKSSVALTSGMNGAPTLAERDRFGHSVAAIGDLDGDGVTDLAVGAILDATAGSDSGAVYILFLNSNGTVKNTAKIANGLNNGPVPLNDPRFGIAVSGIGDIDGDGVGDLAVGALEVAPYFDGIRGAVYILRMNPNGSVKSGIKIGHQQNGGPTLVERDAYFGSAIASLGDLDGDGITDLAVGADGGPWGDPTTDAVYVLFLNADGSVRSSKKIGHQLNGGPVLSDRDQFGSSLACPGDVDGDGITDLLVGAEYDASTGNPRGALYVLLLNRDGSVRRYTKIADGQNGGPTLNNYDNFGRSVAAVGDVDGDGVLDVAVGAYVADGGRGVTYLMPLAPSAFNDSELLDFGDAPDLTPGVGPGDYQTSLVNVGPRHDFSHTLTTLFLGAHVDGEFDSTGNPLADLDDSPTLWDDEDGVVDRAHDLWLTIGAAPVVRLRATNLTGASATLYGWIDYNGDGQFDNQTERASTAVPGGTSNAVVALNFPKISGNALPGRTYARFRLSADPAAANPTGLALGGEIEDYPATIQATSSGSVDAARSVKIANNLNGGPALLSGDAFGRAVANLGDLDGDGINDLAVGSAGDDTGGTNRGAIYISLLNRDGSAKSQIKIASGVNGGPVLANNSQFGASIAMAGDINGDGVEDLVVGAPNDSGRGAIYLLLLQADGKVKSSVKIGHQLLGGPTLPSNAQFGFAVAPIGDFDGDGVDDLAVGAPGLGLGANAAIHLLFLTPDGSVRESRSISGSGYFGKAITSLGDLDGDGVTDLAVGIPGDDAGGSLDLERGAVDVLFLRADGSVKSRSTIRGGILGSLLVSDGDRFGTSVANLGDLDGDGHPDLAVGSFRNDSSGFDQGAAQLLFLRSDGSVRNSILLAGQRNGGPTLADSDFFGFAITSLGDLNADGRPELAISATGDGEPSIGAVHILFLDPLHSLDFGDAPDVTSNVGAGDYQTRLAENGPRHDISNSQWTLYLGTGVDGELGAAPGAGASGDDLDRWPSDEDGIVEPDRDLVLTVGAAPVLRLHANVQTQVPATLYGWIDYNRDGVFDTETEGSSAVAAANAGLGTFVMPFPPVPLQTLPGVTYARFRLSTDPAAADPNGFAADGEVEDYVVTITRPSDLTINESQTRKIADNLNGGPPLADRDLFGSSVASLGDFDGDGIGDLAVGAYGDDSGQVGSGAVYLLMLNADSTVKTRHKINTDDTAIFSPGYIGSAIASLGDLDGDGVLDLAVGDDGQGFNFTGGVHIFFLTPNGDVKRSSFIGSNTGGGPNLPVTAGFGWSLASLGDMDGDGVTDLAVGTRGSHAAYIVHMNRDGTAKNTLRIASNVNGGPTLPSFSFFGSAVASLGDINGDGVTDLAVGAPGEDGANGAVYILRLNANGSVQSTLRLGAGTPGLETFSPYGSFGSSLTTLGDLDGDGIIDLAVGAEGDDSSGTEAGAFYFLLLRSDGSVKSSYKIASDTNGGPTLVDGDDFSKAIASLGDLNGDGVVELAVSAMYDGTGGRSRGAVYLLSLNPRDIKPPEVELEQALLQADPASAGDVRFRVAFSEPVTGFDVDDLDFTGSTAAGALSAVINGDGPEYEVVVSGMTGTGIVQLSVKAGAALDAAGNSSLASTSADNQVLWYSPTPLQLAGTDILELQAGAILGAVTVPGLPAGRAWTLSIDDPRFELVSGQLRLKSDQSVSRATSTTIPLVLTLHDGAFAADQPVTLNVLPNAFPWHNFALAADADGDHDVDINDATFVIRQLRRTGAGLLTVPKPASLLGGSYFDVDANGQLNIQDAIAVIRALRRNRGGSGEGEANLASAVESAGSSLATDLALLNWSEPKQRR